jgi:hypothetical protein
MVDLLKEKGMSDSELKKLRAMASDSNDRSSPDTMGHFVHGGDIPTRVDAIKMWDSLEPVIRRVLIELK